jgi:hypothetical protein
MAVLKSMTDVVARSALLTQIAQRFGVSEEELRQLAVSQEKPRSSGTTAQERQFPTSTQIAAEMELLQLMLVDRQAALQVEQEDILPAFQQWGVLAKEVVSAWQKNGAIDLGDFLGRLPKPIADRVTKMYVAEPQSDELARQQLLADCVAKIRNTQRKSERERLRQEIREAERRGNDAELRLQLQRLQRWDKQE